MNIAILAKQIPDTRSVKMDEATGTVIRQSDQSVINPLDLYAVRAAFLIKEGATAAGEEVKITAFTMGPPAAEKVLREVIALGVDAGVLITDRAFAGSDTWATSNILAAALNFYGDFDLVICGERATDGDTGQIGPEVAAVLDCNVATFVEGVKRSGPARITVERKNEGGIELVECDLPCVISVNKAIGELGLPTLDGVKKARRVKLDTVTNAELKLAPELIGLKGSPTKVVKIFHPVIKRDCRKIATADSASMRLAVQTIVTEINQ